MPANKKKKKGMMSHLKTNIKNFGKRTMQGCLLGCLFSPFIFCHDDASTDGVRTF